MTLAAYSYPGLSKEAFITELTAHAAADQIVKGKYRDKTAAGFRGCAVGCAIHSIQRVLGKKRAMAYGNHALIEKYLGIPLVLAYLQDRIFEGLPQEQALAWPLRFGEAARAGADLSGVWDKFAPWMLREIALPCVKNDQARDAIIAVAEGYETGWANISPADAADACCAEGSRAATTITEAQGISAANAAYAVYAANAAAYAAYAADAAYATAATANAAANAAYAANAAANAARAGHAADAAYAARAAAHAAAYTRMADKLVELMAAA